MFRERDLGGNLFILHLWLKIQSVVIHLDINLSKAGLKLRRVPELPNQTSKMRWTPKLKEETMEKKASQLFLGRERSRSNPEGKR